MKDYPAIGSFVRVPFIQGEQTAYVIDHVRTGRVKVRAYFARSGRYANGTRNLTLAEIIRPAAMHERPSTLPPGHNCHVV